MIFGRKSKELKKNGAKTNFSDVHLDPEIYAEPWCFDPSRKEASKVDLPYVGWIVGETTGLGMRVAEVALFLLVFDHTLLDKSGEAPTTPPKPN